MLRSRSVIDTAAELVTPPTVMSTPIMPGLDKAEAAGQERDGCEQRRDQRDEQELRRAEMHAREVQREDHEPEPGSLGGPHEHGQAQQRGEARKRVDGAEAQALVAVEYRFREVAEDPLAAAGAHHEDDPDAGEADRHTDHDVGDEDPRRLGAKHDAHRLRGAVT